MAKTEHIQFVQRESRNKGRAEHPANILDLSKARLSEADLREADLRRANLREADLREANLSSADLSWANLRGANLRGANLSGANLRWASLSGADLSGTNFSKADLSEANLSKTRLSETNFGAAYLRDAKGLAESSFEGPCILDIRAIQQSGMLPLPFLRGCGLPDSFIEYLPSLLNEAIQLFSCFISYSHKDKPFAKRLFDTLQGRDIRCWLDEKRIVPVDDVYEQGPADRSIRIWDKILLCCSKDSLSSSWVDNEIDAALEKEERLMKELGRKSVVLIPLDLDGHLRSGRWQGSKAGLMRSRMIADFRGWNRSHERFEAEVRRVILALRIDGGGRLNTSKSLPSSASSMGLPPISAGACGKS
jgi:uncharacterized protein YjbI with pentapeptide repeats